MSLERFFFSPNPMRYSVASVYRCGQEILLSWWYLLVLHPHLWFFQVIWIFMSQSHASGLPEGAEKLIFLSGCHAIIFCPAFLESCRDWLWTEGKWGQDGKSSDNASPFDCPQFSAAPLNRSLAWHQERSFCKAFPAFCFSLQQSTWLAAGMPSGASALWEAMDCPCFLPHGSGILKALALPEILHSRHCVGVLDCMGWGGHLGVKLLKNKVSRPHRDSGELAFQNKGKEVIARVVSEQSSYWMLHTMVVPASTFTAQLPPTLLSQAAVHIWTSNSKAWSDGSTLSSSPCSDGEIPAHCWDTQPANSPQPAALLNNSLYSTSYYETMTTDWGFQILLKCKQQVIWLFFLLIA